MNIMYGYNGGKFVMFWFAVNTVNYTLYFSIFRRWDHFILKFWAKMSSRKLFTMVRNLAQEVDIMRRELIQINNGYLREGPRPSCR